MLQYVNVKTDVREDGKERLTGAIFKPSGEGGRKGLIYCLINWG